jgi:hypothetical protein
MKFTPYKRDLLYRASQGKIIVNHLEKKLEKLLISTQAHKNLIDLAKTDKIIGILNEMNVIECTERKFTCINECFSFVASKISGRNCYILIDDDWKYCGALHIDPEVRLNTEFNFDENNSDEIRFIFCDLTTQITIDYFQDTTNTPYECTLKRYTPIYSTYLRT